jgi:tRNA threonylcarbamoyladenosine biosynthesis protein TsaE
MDARIEIHTEKDTERLAAAFAAVLQPGDALALTGDLGAGKTAFARYLARALGVPEDQAVTSPTFTLQNIYHHGRLKLVHVDLYRLAGLDELEALGAEDWRAPDCVLLVEWAEKGLEVLGADFLHLEIDLGPDEERTFRLRATGPRSEALLRDLSALMTR